MGKAVRERRIGRPRSAAADEAILDATIALFTERGFEGLSVEGVAAAAGVGKATIYRRYPCKIDLLVAAAERMGQTVGPTPDTGSLQGDLRAFVRTFHAMLTDSDVGRAIPATLAAMVGNPRLACAHRDLVGRRRTEWRKVVDRAVARGELPPDTDASLLLDLVMGALFFRTFVSREPVDARYCRALADSVQRAFS